MAARLILLRMLIYEICCVFFLLFVCFIVAA